MVFFKVVTDQLFISTYTPSFFVVKPVLGLRG